MIRLLGQVLAFFQNRSNSEEGQQRLLQDEIKAKRVKGVVTSWCNNYGLIDDTIYFTADAVGNVPLRVGQRVTATVEEDETTSELKAVKVDLVDDSGPSGATIKILIGYVSSVTRDTVWINKRTSFSRDIICEGFVPYKGDWMEVEYSQLPRTSKIEVHSAKPLKYKHLRGVCINSVRGRTGVIEDGIFFTLECLERPAHYIPQPYDVIDVVAVQSMQSSYNWRAISITPARILCCDSTFSGGGMEGRRLQAHLDVAPLTPREELHSQRAPGLLLAAQVSYLSP
ncbi:cancer/testis antigen 55 [Ctenodactylus gundi]